MQNDARQRRTSSLEHAKRRLDRWRRSRRGCGRIPDELWQIAAEAASVHGAQETAARLRLDVGRLKKWMDILGLQDGPPARFVELPPFSAEPTSQCTLELEEPSGRKLRISLKGQATTQAVELGQLLWRDRP